MASLFVRGGQALSGSIEVSGNKNAVLPMLCATLLTEQKVVLRNVPDITDVRTLVAYFRELGSSVQWEPGTRVMHLQHAALGAQRQAPPLPAGMRSSLLLLPALLVRAGSVVLHGDTQGCALGIRELDPHIEALTALGARLHRGSELQLTLDGRFVGARLWQDYMSVTTTENFVMAAALGRGTSVLINAASEPHVQDLCRMLLSMGARIEGIGSSKLVIHGVEALSGVDAEVSPDHHEITTFLAIGAITGGDVRVSKVDREHFDLIDRAFKKLSIEIEHDGDSARVAGGQRLAVRPSETPNLLPRIEAAPWPYFPVDLLPLMVALAVRARGTMQFWNKIYAQRGTRTGKFRRRHDSSVFG